MWVERLDHCLLARLIVPPLLEPLEQPLQPPLLPSIRHCSGRRLGTVETDCQSLVDRDGVEIQTSLDWEDRSLLQIVIPGPYLWTVISAGRVERL